MKTSVRLLKGTSKNRTSVVKKPLAASRGLRNALGLGIFRGALNLMKYGASGACFCFAATLASAQVPNLPGWDLIWNDEFDGAALDTTQWLALNRKDSFNNEKQYYLPDQIGVSGGQLHITATDQPFGGKQYRSGLVQTLTERTFGRFEVRADLPSTQGMWPAIWLLPQTVNWPTGGEIDILENRGSQPNQVLGSYHWGTSVPAHQFVNQSYTATDAGGLPVNFQAGFHDYAVEWDPDQISYFVDGNPYFTVNSNTAPISSTPMSLIINLAVGGDFGGDPDGTTVFPQVMDIEYARYWQRNTAPPPPPPPPSALINAGFDSGGGSLAGWTPFGNPIGNVLSELEVSFDGTHAMKIFGQFNGSPNQSGAYQGIAVTEGQEISASASAYVRSLDTLAGKNNQVFMKLEYYSTFGGLLGSPDFLSEVQVLIADGTTLEDAWLQHQISDIAPTGAVEARISFVFDQPGFDNGAIHIDGVSLTALDPTVIGDINGDGFVGVDDLNLILGAWNATIAPGAAADPSGDGFVGVDDLNLILGNWNSGTPPAEVVIPEPTALITLGFYGLGILLRGRR